MRIELRVDRNGQTIFRAECDTERGSSSFAKFSKLVLSEFSHRHPEVSLLDDDIWLIRRGSMSRDPKDWLTIMGQCHVRVLRHHTWG